jgi:hypothetical protein
MTFDDEDDLRKFKTAVFNAGTSPAREYVEFFATAMRWPVDAFAPETRTVDGAAEHHVTWLKGNTIGHAVCGAGATPTVSTAIHPLHAITRVEVGATVRENNFGQTESIMRSLTVHFVDGDPLIINLNTFSAWTQRKDADAFIDVVLDALT